MGANTIDLLIPADWLAEFDAAAERSLPLRIEVEGFPVCHTDDIIASKEADE